MQQSLVQTQAQHIHILKMLHRLAPTAHFQVNYSYNIYAKHELQSLEKNQIRIISLHTDKGQLKGTEETGHALVYNHLNFILQYICDILCYYNQRSRLFTNIMAAI